MKVSKDSKRKSTFKEECGLMKKTLSGNNWIREKRSLSKEDWWLVLLALEMSIWETFTGYPLIRLQKWVLEFSGTSQMSCSHKVTLIRTNKVVKNIGSWIVKSLSCQAKSKVKLSRWEKTLRKDSKMSSFTLWKHLKMVTQANISTYKSRKPELKRLKSCIIS